MGASSLPASGRAGCPNVSSDLCEFFDSVPLGDPPWGRPFKAWLPGAQVQVTTLLKLYPSQTLLLCSLAVPGTPLGVLPSRQLKPHDLGQGPLWSVGNALSLFRALGKQAAPHPHAPPPQPASPRALPSGCLWLDRFPERCRQGPGASLCLRPPDSGVTSRSSRGSLTDPLSGFRKGKRTGNPSPSCLPSPSRQAETLSSTLLPHHCPPTPCR